MSPTTSNRRLAVLAALALCLLAGVTALTAAASARAGAGDPLLPNLITLNIKQHDLVMEKGGKKPLLELTNEVANVGHGPLEIIASDDSSNCDGDGNPNNDRDAFQRIYDDDGSGVFERAADTQFNDFEFGCEHQLKQYYWQIWNLARYKLLDEQTRAAAAKSEKVAYCTIDGAFHFNLPGNPEDRYYPTATCEPGGALGISIGWADVYGYGSPGQEIDVSKVPAGRYCLFSKADPRNLLQETDDHDNVREVPVRVNPAKLTVKRLEGECRSTG